MRKLSYERKDWELGKLSKKENLQIGNNLTKFERKKGEWQRGSRPKNLILCIKESKY